MVVAFSLLFLASVVLLTTAKLGHHHERFNLNDPFTGTPASSAAAYASRPGGEGIKIETIELPLDHFGSTNCTFSNRFSASTELYRPGGPVIVFDAGEANAFPTHDGLLSDFLDETSRLRQSAAELGGVMVRWEHRFYGQSTPWAIEASLPAKSFEFLTTEQALADVATFAWTFRREDLPDVDFTPQTTPWIFVGGSYSGMRAAFMREFYPETIHVAYASSAPVQAQVDMSVYFDMIWRGMEAGGFCNCSQDIKSAVRRIDELLEDPKSAAAIKERFYGPDAAKNSNEGFADALATTFHGYQGFGLDIGSPYSTGAFCEWLPTDASTNETSPAEGWAVTRGVDFVIDRWSKWFWKNLLLDLGMNTKCRLNESLLADDQDCDFDKQAARPSSIAWRWQYCTEWGFLQSANLGHNQVVSKFNSLRHRKEVCERQFPDGQASGLLPEWPAANITNARFGGWDLMTSNTFWTVGEFDPWRMLSILSDEDFSPKLTTTSDIPECGAPSRDVKSVFGDIIPGAQHCFDFTPGYRPADSTWELFYYAARKWLSCWNPRGARVRTHGSIPGRAVRIPF